MGRTAEPGGDYGYDMAHQDVPRTPDRRGDEPEAPPPGAGDAGGDHGYDEAHDF